MAVVLADQHAREHAETIEFFGRPAATYTSPARLHAISGAPVIVGTCIRTGLMKYRLQLSKPLSCRKTGHRRADLRSVLQAITAELEQAIRRHPEQYLWSHRRWRM